MISNTFSVQLLVMVHVMAHCIVFENNRWFRNTRKDLIQVLSNAAHRVNKYESIYGIDEVEQVIDAGRALQFHSSPFDLETESEKKIRVYNNLKKKIRATHSSEFADIGTDSSKNIFDAIENIEQFNYELLRNIQRTTPIEPTEDILRFIIDNSKYLEDWQKDILEICRMEGQYYWPIIRTKYINEGTACFFHEKVINELFKEGYLDSTEHGQYNYSNSLVKAQSVMSMNPYLIGSEILSNIEDRWNKGKHGIEYENCTDYHQKENWDTHEMKGIEKIKEVISTYTDWMLFQDFLTEELIDKLDLYIYVSQETPFTVDYIRTGHGAKQIKELIISCFANSSVPKIEVVSSKDNNLVLKHNYSGLPLDRKYSEETMKHICRLWGNTVYLETESDDKKIIIKVGEEK